MASLSTDRNGGRRIQFSNARGERKSIRLGRIEKRQAESIRTHIEQLVNAQLTQLSMPRETAAWVSSLDFKMIDKLARAGLIEPRQEAPTVTSTLAAYLDAYIQRRADVKAGTVAVYRHTKRCLVQYFGASKPLGAITLADAANWQRWMTTHKFTATRGRKSGQLAENTVRRRCGIARQFFCRSGGWSPHL